jgi:hypothetical protein
VNARGNKKRKLSPERRYWHLEKVNAYGNKKRKLSPKRKRGI